MALPTLRDLAAFTAPPVDRTMLVKSFADMADAARMRTERQQQQAQFDAAQANAMQRHRDDLGYNYANLGETTRSNKALESDRLMGRQQTVRDAQEKVAARIRAAAVTGAPPEVIRSMIAEAKAQGIDVTEQMSQPEPQAAPKPLSSFMGHGTLAPPPAPPPEEPKPTGRFTIGDLGTVDQPAIRQEQRADRAKTLAAFAGMGTPIDRHAYQGGAAAAMELPGADPATALEAATKASRQAAGDANANARAREISVRSSNRGADLNTTRADTMAMRKATTVRSMAGLQQINDAERAADDAVAMMEQGNPLSQHDAFLAHLRAQQGSRPTDKDLVFQLQQGGLWTRLQSAISRAASGEFDESYRGLFIQAAKVHQRLLQQRRREVAGKVHNAIMSSPAIRGLAGPEGQFEYAEEQAAAVLGSRSDPRGDGGQAGAGGGSSASVSARGDIVPGPDELGDVLDPNRFEEIE